MPEVGGFQQEQVEMVRPTYREVAVPVPHFDSEGRYTGVENDAWVRGYEVTNSGVIDEATLRRDARFRQDQRLILYASEATGYMERFNLTTGQLDIHFARGTNFTGAGRFDPRSLHLRKGGYLVDAQRYGPVREPAYRLTQDNTPFASEEVMNAMPDVRQPGITNILIRTSEQLTVGEVRQLTREGAVSGVAKGFQNVPQ